MVKLAYDPKMKSPKGPCVVVIHANWCGFCKTLMPKFENQIVASDDFDPELEGALTLGSIEEAEYNNHPEKEVFGKIDGYPIVRYINFSQHGKSTSSFDLPTTTPREPEDIIAWINGAVKNDMVKNDMVKNDMVKNDMVKNDMVKNDVGADMVNKHRKSKKHQQIMNGGGKNKNFRKRTIRRKKRKNSKRGKNQNKIFRK
jgi:hypothetical protein